ncbi:hypothetical protein KAI52_01370 [Candidatus Parcubacteria bacterium]|nr:hypothetical protein [Candidatus Parcubacteria bacterium]
MVFFSCGYCSRLNGSGKLSVSQKLLESVKESSKKEESEVVTKCNRLRMEAEDGKFYLVKNNKSANA